MPTSRTKRKHFWRVLTGFGICLSLLLLTGVITQTSAAAAPAGDGPPGFW